MTNSPIDTKLKRDEGLRRAALHFAEDFILGLDERDHGIFTSNHRKVQAYSTCNFGHGLNDSQLQGLLVFFSEGGRLHKDNRYIFHLASFMCDLLDDSLDIRSK